MSLVEKNIIQRRANANGTEGDEGEPSSDHNAPTVETCPATMDSSWTSQETLSTVSDKTPVPAHHDNVHTLSTGFRQSMFNNQPSISPSSSVSATTDPSSLLPVLTEDACQTTLPSIRDITSVLHQLKDSGYLLQPFVGSSWVPNVTRWRFVEESPYPTILNRTRLSAPNLTACHYHVPSTSAPKRCMDMGPFAYGNTIPWTQNRYLNHKYRMEMFSSANGRKVMPDRQADALKLKYILN
jgi:hypothetical protein